MGGLKQLHLGFKTFPFTNVLIFEIVEPAWAHQALLCLEKKRVHSTNIYPVQGGELKGTAGNTLLFSNVEVEL